MKYIGKYESFLGNKQKSQEARKTIYLSRKIYNFLKLFHLYDLKLNERMGAFGRPYNEIYVAGKLFINITLNQQEEIAIDIKNPEYFRPKMVLPMNLDRYLVDIFSKHSHRVYPKYSADAMYINTQNVDTALKELTKDKLEFYSNVNKYNL